MIDPANYLHALNDLIPVTAPLREREHYQPHLRETDTMTLCQCGCNDCRTSLEGLCVCKFCDCLTDVDHAT